MSKKVFITGITGQDGAYLSKLLISKGYKVFGAHRKSSCINDWRLKSLGVFKKINFVEFDFLSLKKIIRTIEKIEPEMIFNLAAQSSVSTSFEKPIITSEINGLGALKILEAIKVINKRIKLYQASSSEMFGKAVSNLQDEKTPFYPKSPYGMSKLFAHWANINYRETYQMFVCSGILFNHESPLRGNEYITKKIVSGLTKIKFDKQKVLKIGNIETKRDWGYAEDYVDGIFKIISAKYPDDFILATGKSHSIKEFCELTAKVLEIDLVWEGEGSETKGINRENGNVIIEIDKTFYRPADVDYLIGNAKKANTELNWFPKTKLEQLVEIMVRFEVDLQQ